MTNDKDLFRIAQVTDDPFTLVDQVEKLQSALGWKQTQVDALLDRVEALDKHIHGPFRGDAETKAAIEACFENAGHLGGKLSPPPAGSGK